MADRLFIIDGHALVFKMYYAFARHPMINSKGVDTSILFGFTKYLLELIAREQPSHLAVSFDPPGGTFRNEMYPEYKANRAETPQLVIDALQPLTDILQAMDIPVLMVPGYEADDVIGTLAGRFAAQGYDVYMVTPDKDYGQLIGDHVWQYKPGKGGGEAEIFGVKEICGRYGIDSPSQVIDMLALCGDSADNVPGVSGIGEVTAAKLISKYGSVAGIYQHLDELKPRQQEQFLEARPHMDLTVDLVTIRTDVPVEADADSMRLDVCANPAVMKLFDLYEFNSLRRYLRAPGAQAAHSGAQDGSSACAGAETLTVEPVSPEQLLSAALVQKRVGIMPAQAGKVAVVAGTGQEKYAGCVISVPECGRLLEGRDLELCGHGMKPLVPVRSGMHPEARFADTELMHYLIDPERPHDFDVLCREFLGMEPGSSPCGQQAEASLFGQEDSEVDDGACMRSAAAVLKLSEALRARLREDGLEDLYYRVEEPLVHVLAHMEDVGVMVDLDSLREFAAELREDIARSEAAVREMAGEPQLNVSSPRQLGVALFEKMRLDPKAKKPSKGSWSTDEETLTALYDRSPIIGEILQYRAARKLLSTYIEPLPSFISPVDGRVHTTFNQTLTATGRLSSSNPNLQNIPVRTERGQQIRKAFRSQTPGGLILSADYSQIELRIMAHLSGDEHLLAAFRAGQDVHRATAAKIFGVAQEEVSTEQRRIAKTANFGIMYGISAFGLAQRLGIPRAEAKQIIDDYFASFPSIRAFIDSTLQQARQTQYVQTLFGRRRYVPGINATNANIRALSERNAVNAPIQGTSADIIKMAMIAVDEALQREGLTGSRMVLQIHDELLFETVPSEVQRLAQTVKREMEGVCNLSVPLTVECNYGENWLEAH